MIASCPYLSLVAQLAPGCVWLCMNNMTTLVRALRLWDGLWLRCSVMWGNVSALTPGRGLKWCSRHLLAQWSPVRSYQELNDNWPSIWHKHWSLSWYHWVNLFTSCSSYLGFQFSMILVSCIACASHGRITLCVCFGMTCSQSTAVWLGSDCQILKSAYRRILDTALPLPSSPGHRLPGPCLLWTMACFQFIDYPPLMGANIPTPKICQQIRYFPPAIDR